MAIGLSCLVGCASSRTAIPSVAFPTDLVQDHTLDIHVLREVRTIRMTNTTPNPLPAGRLWLNKWFSRDLPEGLGVGQSISLDLGEFVDEFGEAFRGGGFFAGLDPDDLVLAQYQTTIDGEDVLLGMIVIDGRPK